MPQIQAKNFLYLTAGAILASACFLAYNGLKQPTKQQKKFDDFKSNQYQLLKEEQLARIIKYFGPQKFSTLQNSYVIVFGVGGVGSHVVNMLARSGVKKIRVVDFDRVSLSSLNRHAFAFRKDVGNKKVDCIKNYVEDILPHIEIEAVEKYVTVQNANELIDEKADYIVDCIDNLDAKAEIVSICTQKNIKLIISGGAGMKCDPTKIQIRDISDCKYDNLIMRLKRQLSKKNIKKGVKVVFSYQQADKELLPLSEEQEKDPTAFKVFDNYRIRIIPVLGTMPAIIGMSIASYVLCDLAGEAFKPFETDYVKSTLFSKLYNQFLNDEKKRGCQKKDLEVDMEQICIISKEIYKWKCLISGKKQNSSDCRVTRWNPQLPASIDNLALFSKAAYQKHIQYKSLKEASYSEEIISTFKENSVSAKKFYDKGFMTFI